MTFRIIFTVTAASVATMLAVKLLDTLMDMEKGQER